jgi:transcriptional regulator with XRE-family HTH domain
MKISSFTSDDRLRLADRIRLARHAAKLSQTALAERVGVTPSAAAQWEHPHGTSPGVHRLQAIAAATGVIFDWLATGHGDQRRRRSQQDSAAPLLKLDLFAQDRAEEIVLERFRMLSPRGRQMLSGLLEEIKPRRR